jgi:NAD(P)-dependent dehydrogenase (short-subunit alcohol dehydrogenase family)
VRVLVTGSARAIGRATVEALLAAGHEVVATARRPELLEGMGATQCLPLDVRDADSVRRAIAAAGELDAVVNNAAVSASGPLEDLPLDRLHDAIDTNAIGALRVVQAVAPAWRDRGSGVIVNVSSVQGRVSTPLDGAYAASKFALEALSETLHYELGHFGIRTVVIEPGYIAPGMKDAPSHPGPDAYAELWSQWEGTDDKVTGSGGRPGPELVANAIVAAIEDPATPLRVPVGADAELILGTRRQLDDEAFEATMRQALGLDW